MDGFGSSLFKPKGRIVPRREIQILSFLFLSKREKYNTEDMHNQAFLSSQPSTSKESNFFFITKYHDGIKPVQNIIKDNWYILGKTPQTEHLYESNLTTGFKRNDRLKDLLVSTQIPLAPSTAGTAGKILRKCPDLSKCDVCPF